MNESEFRRLQEDYEYDERGRKKSVREFGYCMLFVVPFLIAISTISWSASKMSQFQCGNNCDRLTDNKCICQKTIESCRKGDSCWKKNR